MGINFQFPKLELLVLTYVVPSLSHSVSNPSQRPASQVCPFFTLLPVPQSTKPPSLPILFPIGGGVGGGGGVCGWFFVVVSLAPSSPITHPVQHAWKSAYLFNHLFVPCSIPTSELIIPNYHFQSVSLPLETSGGNVDGRGKTGGNRMYLLNPKSCTWWDEVSVLL